MSAVKTLLLWAACFCAGIAPAQNLIYNGSFELGTEGFALHRIVTHPEKPAPPLELERGQVFRGKNSLCFSNPDGDYFELYVSAFALKPDTEYEFSMAAKTDVKDGIPLEALIHTARWDNKRKTFQIGGQYRKYHFRFNSRSGGKHVIRLWSFPRDRKAGGWKGKLYLDDISVAEAGSSVGSVSAAVSAPEYWKYQEDKDFPLMLNVHNDTGNACSCNLAVSVTDDRKNAVFSGRLPISLPPGGVRSVPLKKFLPNRYGAYTFHVEGQGITTRDFPLVVIGKVDPRPRDPERGIVQGINGSIGLRSGYASGKLIERQGIHTSNAGVEAAYQLYQIAGFKLLREWGAGQLPTDWPTAEPQEGKYDFRFFDFCYHAARKYGLTQLHVLGGELFRQVYLKTGYARTNPIPEWAMPRAIRPTEHPPCAMAKLKGYIAYPPKAEWRRFLQHLAAHSRGYAHCFEFTNEPNLYVTPQVYNEYLKLTCQALKAGDPNVKIVGYSVTSDFGTDGSSWFEQAVKDGSAACCDAVSFHPYSQRELGSFQSADKLIQTIRKTLEQARTPKNLWNTELFYLYDTASKAADESVEKAARPEFLINRFLVDCGENVRQFCVLQDRMLWRIGDYYLNYDAELIPSVYFAASNTLARLFDAAQPVAKYRPGNGIAVYVFRKDGQLIAGVWNYLKMPGISLDLNKFRVLDTFGNEIPSGLLPISERTIFLRAKPGMSEADFLQNCAGLRPVVGIPVAALPDARLSGKLLIVKLQNRTQKTASGELGAAGENLVAGSAVPFRLAPGESRSFAVLLETCPENRNPLTAKVMLDGKIFDFPLKVHRAPYLENGKRYRLKSKDLRCAAEVTFQADGQRFVMTADVTDRSNGGKRGKRDLWQCDGIELFLDTNAAELDPRAVHRYTQSTSRFFILPRDPEVLTLWSKEFQKSDCRCEVKSTASGYRVMLELPRVNALTAAGLKINDAENASQNAVTKLVLSLGENAHSDRLAFGILQEPQPPVKRAEKIRWMRNYSSKRTIFSQVPNRDFLFGKTLLKLEPDGSLVSCDVPVRSGKKYEAVFYAKSDLPRQMTVMVEAWQTPHRGDHFYYRFKAETNSGWKKFVFPFSVPADAGKYTDLKAGKLRLKILVPPGSGAIYLSSVEPNHILQEVKKDEKDL